MTPRRRVFAIAPRGGATLAGTGLRRPEGPTVAQPRPRGQGLRSPRARPPFRCRRAFTLIELLIVVAIIAILAAIATPNFLQAHQRAQMASGASNLHVVAIALQSYMVDHNSLPPGDREAGPFQSHDPSFAATGNGPAAGGSWDGLPWLLVDLGYVKDPNTMFCPKYRTLYAGGETLRGGHPRYHNFRYAYNSAGLASGGHAGGVGNVMNGDVWIVRDLWLPANAGWHGGSAPDYPADYEFPWGEGNFAGKVEQAIFADGAVRTLVGGTDELYSTAIAAR